LCRGSLFGLVKFFLQKEVNAKEVAALVNFLYAMRQQPAVLAELLAMLLLYLDSKQGTQRVLYVLQHVRLDGNLEKSGSLLYKFNSAIFYISNLYLYCDSLFKQLVRCRFLED
jgi:hypothetical protein